MNSETLTHVETLTARILTAAPEHRPHLAAQIVLEATPNGDKNWVDTREAVREAVNATVPELTPFVDWSQSYNHLLSSLIIVGFDSYEAIEIFKAQAAFIAAPPEEKFRPLTRRNEFISKIQALAWEKFRISDR